MSAPDNKAEARQELGPRLHRRNRPESTGSFDREITFGTPLPVVDWKTGEPEQVGAVLQVTTRPAVLYTHLFAALGEFVRGVVYILIGVGIFFALIELIALIIGTRMTRTVTAAVAELHDATRHVDRGDFSHRIPVRSNDQLSDLALSFNSMTASIEKLILEQKEKQRLENELLIAQEVQAQLFPRQVSELESLEVHGFCRPARTVSGDYYDFLTASSHKLILAVGDISGKGISAALLMATIHSAVRAYSVESLAADARTGGRRRSRRSRQSDGHVARGRRSFSRRLARPAEPSALRQHSAGKIRHAYSWESTMAARTTSPTATAGTFRRS